MLSIKDTKSAGEYLQTLRNIYGPLPPGSKQSYWERDERIQKGFKIIEASPNFKQFALAQYLFASIEKHPKQLCHLPPGQGKSRVAATLALLRLLFNEKGQVRFVFPNEHLAGRDEKMFADMWTYFGVKDRISYHTDTKFIETPDDLQIIDECDHDIFKNPEGFYEVMEVCPTVCFTATPGGEKDSNEKDILKWLGLRVIMD